MNSEVQNTHTRFPLSGFTQTCYCFFSHKYEPLPFFFSRPKQLISFMVIHVQHLASLCWICGNKIKDHMRKVDTNHFQFLKFTKSKRFIIVVFSKCSSTVLKKIKERRQISTVNVVFRYLLNIHWLSGIKLKHCRYDSKQRSTRCVKSTRNNTKKQTRKINKFELLFILVMMTGSLILVL